MRSFRHALSSCTVALIALCLALSAVMAQPASAAPRSMTGPAASVGAPGDPCQFVAAPVETCPFAVRDQATAVAPAAQSSWALAGSPNTGDTQTTNLLPGAACLTPTDCWAVGYYDSGSTRYQSLAQHWDGSMWVTVPSANTAATQDNLLQAVACASTSDCWAVGSSGATSRTLIQRWNGTSWTIVPSPNTSASQRNYLNAVTCLTGSDCWAVGYYLAGSTYQTLVERWDGTSWTIVTSPNISPTQNNRLAGVTCSSASLCWAVGSYVAGGIDMSLIERWDGASWTIDTSPNPNATAGNRLLAVTCVSASECWAVGSYNGNSNARTLVERWNGTVWAQVSSPSPTTTQNSFLTSVACASSARCFAVGNYYSGSASKTLVVGWDGSAWTQVASPDPTTGQQSFLTGVSCATAARCFAVGNTYIGSGTYQTLVGAWDGASWSLETSPNVGAMTNNVLSGLACATASACWAVGSASTVHGRQTLIQRWDGSRWVIVPSPNPSADREASLAAVACVSTTECWAVGGGSGSNFYGQTLVERWDGTSWTIVPSPNTSATQGNYLFGVTCTAAADCWAVGTYGASNADQTLVMHWDGTSWAIVPSSNLSPAHGSYLSSVTCASASACWAVGYARDLNAPPMGKTYYAIIERWDGVSWSLDTSPNPDATHNQLLRGVTCVSGTDCWTVGLDFAAGEQYYHTLIERWDGTSWVRVASPNTSASAYNLLSSVTCTSSSDCWAVGNASGASSYETLIARWDGTAWSIVASPNTSATETNVLSSVACASATDCRAIGTYTNDRATRTLSAYYTAGPTPVVAEVPWAPLLPLAAGGALAAWLLHRRRRAPSV